MAESNSPKSDPTLEMPDALGKQLKDFKKTLWTVKILEAVFAALIGLFVAYLVLFVSDRFWDTPKVLRTLTLIAGVLGFAVFVPFWLHRWVWSHQTLGQITHLLRRMRPRLGDRLQGVVELMQQSETKASMSPTLCQAAMNQVADEASKVDLNESVPERRDRPWGFWAAGLALTALLILAIIPAPGVNALKRWLMPWSDTERYTFADIQALDDKVAVPYGEDFEINAQLEEGSKWNPKTAKARLARDKMQASVADGVYTFEVPGQIREGKINISVGDAREDVEIVPMVRPELEALTARVTLPEYLGHKPLELDAITGFADLLGGSQVVFSGTVSRDLQGASANGEKAQVDGALFVTPRTVVQDLNEVQLEWKDIHKLTPKDAFIVKVNEIEDTAPSAVANELSRATSILESEVLEFPVVASDDYGLKEMGIAWEGEVSEGSEITPAKGEMILKKGDQLTTSLDALVSFSPQSLGIDPQKLVVRAFAVDYLPGRERTYSYPHTVYVLDPAEHAEMVKEEFRKIQAELEDIARTEESLHEANLQMSEMDPDDLNSEEGQQQLGEQADAEKENTKEMAELAEKVEELFEDAMRNEEIESGALEEMTKMLSTMKELAEQDMPAVAGKLQEAQQNAQPSESQPSDSQSEQDLEEAIQKQKEVLAKMAKAMDEANKAEEMLEASTFVNRLKKAATNQTNIGNSLIESIESTVGLNTDELEDPAMEELTSLEDVQKFTEEDIGYIQEDLGFFFQRTGKQMYSDVQEEMKEVEVTDALSVLTKQISGNQAGRSIGKTKHWAETFTKWASMLTPEEDCPT